MHWPAKRYFTFQNRPIVQTIKSVWHRVRNIFPFTWVSILLVILMYCVWFKEVSAHANQILFTAILLWFLAFILISMVTILAAIVVFCVTRSLNQNVVMEEKTETGGHLESGYAVYVPFYLPFIDVDVELLEPSLIRHAMRHLTRDGEWLEPIERGRYQTLQRKITVRDIFGLTSVSFVLKQGVSLEVKPSSGLFQMTALTTHTSGEGYSHPEGDPRGELIEMRRYQAGDPLRLVLWKVFARSRKLVVRSPEPAIVEENDMFVYFISGKDDENSASMARAFLKTLSANHFSGEKRDMYFSADGANRIAASESEGLDDVIESKNHRQNGGGDLLNIAPLVTPAAMKHCFLLVPSAPGPWMTQVENFLIQYAITPVFIVSVDGTQLLPKPRQTSGKLRKLFCVEQEHDDRKEALEQVCANLSKRGIVRIVDIKTGVTTEYDRGAQ